MPLDPASALGKLIGSAVRRQSEVEENLTPEDAESQLLYKNQEFIEVAGSVTLTAQFFSEDSFVLDHPVYGELDSSTLVIDGGYKPSGGTFPLTFPISFGTSTSTLYSTTF